MNVALLAALQVVVRADSDPARAVLFASLTRRSRVVRLARWVTHGPFAGSLPATLAVAAYGFATASPCMAASSAPVWALPLYPNDQRPIEAVATWSGLAVGRSRQGLPLLLALLRHLGRGIRQGSARRYVRLVKRLCRRHDFLVACRTATTLATAMVAAVALPGSGVRAVLVSSDYNAEAVGLCWAARRLGLACIYVAHAPAHHLSPPLDFALSVLDGEAALDLYRQKGRVRGRWVFKGVEGVERPLVADALARPSPVVGLLLPKEVDWVTFRAVVAQARRGLAPRKLLVRWHPNAMERPRLKGVLDDPTGIEACPAGSRLDEDARRCDWVIVDRNSSAALAALKAGVPVVTVPQLAVFPGQHLDLYGLIANGVVPPPCASLLELRPASLVPFYQGSWADRFRRYDAAYGRPPGEVAAEVRRAVLEVLGEQPDGRT